MLDYCLSHTLTISIKGQICVLFPLKCFSLARFEFIKNTFTFLKTTLEMLLTDREEHKIINGKTKCQF